MSRRRRYRSTSPREPIQTAIPASARGAAEPERHVLGGFNWSSQHLDEEGCDGQAGWVDEGVDGSGADEVAGEAVDRVGGRAVVFWLEIAEGLSSEEAARAGRACRRAVGVRWFRERGGMPTFMLGPVVGAVSVV